jgi:tetratricopeptide (TPR) repeat protein
LAFAQERTVNASVIQPLPKNFDRTYAQFQRDSLQFRADRDFANELKKKEELVAYLEQFLSDNHWLIRIERLRLESTRRAVALRGDLVDKFSLARKRFEGGQSFAQLNNHRKALEYYADALDAYRQSLGNEDIATLDCLHLVAVSELLIGDLDHAWEHGRELIGISSRLLGSNHPRNVYFGTTLATIALFREDYKVCEAMISDSLDSISSLNQSERPDHARLLAIKAKMLNRTGRHREAISVGQSATAIAAMDEPRQVGVLVESQAQIAIGYLGCGEPDQCVYVFRRLRPYFEKHSDAIPTGREFREWMTSYREALVKVKRDEDAAEIAEIIRDIKEK